MENAGVYSHSAAALAWLVFAALQIPWLQRRTPIITLFIATLASVIWAASIALTNRPDILNTPLLPVATELLRNTAWLLFLLSVIVQGTDKPGTRGVIKKLTAGVGLIVLISLLVFVYGLIDTEFSSGRHYFEYRTIGNLLIAAMGLLLVEQLVRHINPDQRWSVKFLCIGIGVMFTCDFYLYSDALLLKSIDAVIWDVRGAVNLLIVPMLVISVARNRQLALELFVSRQFVLHTTTLLMAGLYLLAMGVGGYYIRIYGGNWGGFAQLTFMFAAVMLLIILLFSKQLRAYARVLLSKHFYKNRYDYREEWLRLIDRLSKGQSDRDVRENALRAIADIADSSRGMLWLKGDNSDYQCIENIGYSRQKTEAEPADSSLASFLQQKGWVINIDEYRRDADEYSGLGLPDWITTTPELWLIVPLMQQNNLHGYVVLSHPRSKASLNWEERDMLLMAGREVAGYLALSEANSALAAARQFEAFNRLSAYVVHDLKNIVAQLSLVVSNAEKHRGNPAFVDDAISTVDNASTRMNRLLGQLRKGQERRAAPVRVGVKSVLEQVISNRSLAMPVPHWLSEADPVDVLADRDRLADVLEHLVQNAQEATPDDGYVGINMHIIDGHSVIQITDNGCGMSEDFIHDELFKPFATTKGNAGMGIGAYEAREFIQSIMGSIQVESEPGHGTTFRLSIPVVP